MDLSKFKERLSELPRQALHYFDNGQIVRKSYPKVAEDVERALTRLKSSGVKRLMRVGILSENCYEWIVYEIALLHVGCVIVSFPLEELAGLSLDELAEKYAINLLLISAKEQERRQEAREWVTVMNREDSLAQVRHPHMQKQERKSDAVSLDPDIFSLVFSSGTSGRLKCLLISKCGTEELLTAYGRFYEFESTDRILVALPLSINQQRVLIYTALWYGCDICLTDPTQIFRALKEMEPSIVAGPPIFYETLENRFYSLSSRKRLLLTTVGRAIHRLPFERLRTHLLRKWFKPFHDAFGGHAKILLTGSAPSRQSTLDLYGLLGLPLYQSYGLTETGNVSWNLPGANRPGSVGKPIFENAVIINDDGEIIFCHPHPLSRGYLYGEGEDERETFLAHNRIATGDLGRFDQDGYLYIIGRKKQIIVTQSGHKIQPETLERKIEQSPDVARAVVFGGGELSVLVALVSLRAEDEPSARERVKRLVDDLNETLPSPSRIGRFTFTTTQFRTDNGLLNRNLKVDRRTVYECFRDSLVGME